MANSERLEFFRRARLCDVQGERHVQTDDVAAAMKGQQWVRWVLTGLLAALMLLAAIPDVLRVPGALSVFRHLGYPEYLLPFLGTAKILGVAAILVPGHPKLREWAFAGLAFDLTGALYSHISVGDPPRVWMPAFIGLALLTGSYVAHRMPSHQRASRDGLTAPEPGAVERQRLHLNT